jgi:hypothetical protein
MSNTSYIDINGIYDTEKNFLDQIRNRPNIDANKVSEIQQKIQSSYNKLEQSKSTSNNLHTQQKKMINIVDTEKERLEKKKHSIDNALDGQKRLITLNESYRLRNNDYTTMLVTAVISFTVLLGSTMIGRNFPIIPSILIDIIYIITISITLYILYQKYMDILNHDRIYYNEINLDSPQMLTPEQIAKQTAAAQQNAVNSSKANLLSTINIGGCVGPLCCSGDSYWDATNSICTTGNTMAGFTTLNLAYGNGEFLLKPSITITDKIQPNSPNEFIRYGKV